MHEDNRTRLEQKIEELTTQRDGFKQRAFQAVVRIKELTESKRKLYEMQDEVVLSLKNRLAEKQKRIEELEMKDLTADEQAIQSERDKWGKLRERIDNYINTLELIHDQRIVEEILTIMKELSEPKEKD
jgi:hypothetical protein